MFDTYAAPPKGFSPPLFVTQLLLAPLGGLILGGLTYTILSELFRVKDSNLIGYLVFSAQGFLLGFRFQTAFPRAIESGGRWVWVAPACNLLIWILYELGRGPVSHVGDFFSFPQARGNEGGIEMILITWPAISSCFYSVGIHAAGRPPRGHLGNRLHKLIAGGLDGERKFGITTPEGTKKWRRNS